MRQLSTFESVWLCDDEPVPIAQTRPPVHVAKKHNYHAYAKLKPMRCDSVHWQIIEVFVRECTLHSFLFFTATICTQIFPRMDIGRNTLTCNINGHFKVLFGGGENCFAADKLRVELARLGVQKVAVDQDFQTSILRFYLVRHRNVLT